jgi:RNA polymerase sigma-70 factor (ECF subfamily)
MPLLDPLFNFASWLTHESDRSGRPCAGDVREGIAWPRLVLSSAQIFVPGSFAFLRDTFLTSCTGLQDNLTMGLDAEDEAPVAVTWETPETLALASASREALQSALDELPIAYREVILLCDVEEMKYKDIAEVLSVPIGTVMSRLARGRKLLRQVLAGDSAIATVTKKLEQRK